LLVGGRGVASRKSYLSTYVPSHLQRIFVASRRLLKKYHRNTFLTIHDDKKQSNNLNHSGLVVPWRPRPSPDQIKYQIPTKFLKLYPRGENENVSMLAPPPLPIYLNNKRRNTKSWDARPSDICIRSPSAHGSGDVIWRRFE
jgi:uncharacterized Zn-finger protein